MPAGNVGCCCALLLSLSCAGERAKPAGAPPPAASSPAAVLPVAEESAARPPEHVQLLVVGPTSPIARPIVFENRAFLELRSGWVSIQGDTLSAPQRYWEGIKPNAWILAATGNFPERAWLLVVLEDQTKPLLWNRDHWEPTSVGVAASDPPVRDLDLCRWGQQHLLLRVEQDAQGKSKRSFFELLDSDVRPPTFTSAAAPLQPRCVTRLEADSCFSLPNGGLVVLGAACGVEDAQASEYFAPNGGAGVPLELLHAQRELVWINSGSSNGAELYLGGLYGAERSPYLARISGAGHVEELEVPAYIDAIDRVAADEDGGVWVHARRRDKKIDFGSDGVWRRGALGSWSRVAIESRLPGKPGWGISNGGFGLFPAGGSVWLEVVYSDSGAKHHEGGVQHLLLRNRETAHGGALQP